MLLFFIQGDIFFKLLTRYLLLFVNIKTFWWKLKLSLVANRRVNASVKLIGLVNSAWYSCGESILNSWHLYFGNIINITNAWNLGTTWGFQMYLYMCLNYSIFSDTGHFIYSLDMQITLRYVINKPDNYYTHSVFF